VERQLKTIAQKESLRRHESDVYGWKIETNVLPFEAVELLRWQQAPPATGIASSARKEFNYIAQRVSCKIFSL